MNTLKSMLLFIVLAVFAASCENPVSPEDPKCEVSLNADNIELEVGETQTISANKSKGCTSSLKFNVSNSNVASVKKVNKTSAEITAKQEGEATINIISKETDEKVAGINIKVTFNPIVTYHKSIGSNDQNIWIADENGNERRLTDNSNQSLSPQWIQNNERIAYLEAGSNGISIRSTDLRGYGSSTITNSFHFIGSFDLSPDGEKLVISGRKDFGGPIEIYTQNLNNNEINRITFEDKAGGNVPSNPEWSPDGKEISFSSYREGNWEIYMVDQDGSNIRNITNDPNSIDGGVNWSPFNENKISFSSDKNGELSTYTMDLSNGSYNFVTDEFGCTGWVSENELICEGQKNGNDFDIYKVKLDGSYEILFNTSDNNNNPDWKN